MGVVSGPISLHNLSNIFAFQGLHLTLLQILQAVCRTFAEFKSLEARAYLEARASLGIVQCVHNTLGNFCRIKTEFFHQCPIYSAPYL